MTTAAEAAPSQSARSRSTSERMSTLDAEFFFAEHGNVPMHIGSVAVFDGPAPSREDLMRLFEAKLPLVPRYRQVARSTPFQLLRPVWRHRRQRPDGAGVRRGSRPAPA
jgi:Wax ester synthase-like Acyl-CoA acyltransferase domain